MISKSLRLLLLLGFAATSKLFAATYYVNGNPGITPLGNDSNPGTSAAPFKTIQRAANAMLTAGDVCQIRGGVYRERVIVQASNVTFQAYGSEIVTISGADPITAWQLESTNVYRATTMPTGWVSLGDGNQVFQGTGTQASLSMKPEARWPNTIETDGTLHPWQNSRLAHPTYNEVGDWSYVNSVSFTTVASISDPQLPSRADDYWNDPNVRVHIISGHGWIMKHPRVTGYTNATRTLVTNDNNLTPNGAYTITNGNEYYLTGKKAEMDSNGEWFFDTATGRLCFYSSTGAPTTGAGYVEVKTRSHGFDLSNRSNVTLLNLDFFACSIKSNAASTNCVLNGLYMKFLNHSRMDSPEWGLTLRTGYVLRNSELCFDSRGLVNLDGTDIRVINNLFHDSGYVPTWTRMVEALNGDVNTNCTRNLVSHNTLRDSGRSLMGFTGRESIIQYNDLYNAMLLTTDGGIYYAANRAGGNSVFQYNLLHGTVGPVGHSGASVKGFYLDNLHHGWVVHHNIIWGIAGHAMHFGNRQNFNMVFNNTCWEADGGALNTYLNTDGETGTNMFNNLFNTVPNGGENAWKHSDIRYNLYTDPQFATNPDSFQLAPGSPAIDRGTPIPGITTGFTGTAPDLGALEVGGPIWTANVGYNAASAPNPDPTYLPLPAMTFANKVIDGSFESGVIAAPWTSTGTNLSLLAGNSWSDARFRTGAYVLRFTQAAGTSEIRQVVTGLLPNRKYKLYCGVQKTDATAAVKVGVRSYSGTAGTLYVNVPTTGDWVTSRTVQSQLLFNVPFTTGPSNTTAEVYVTVTNPTGSTAPVYVDDFSVQLVPGVPEYAPSAWNSFQLVQNWEAESNFTAVANVGTLGTVGSHGGMTFASNNSAVRIYDPGDTMKMTFTLPQAGKHKLNLRVRAGWTGNDRGYFNNGYAIKVDGQPVTFTGDAESIVHETSFGWTAIYWGTMISPTLTLAAGTHEVEVQSVASYGMVDALKAYVEKVVEAETNFAVVSDVGSTGTIGAQNGYNLANNNHAVRLYDTGDTMRINFTVTQAGFHRLNIRLRSGDPSNDRGFFSNGYTFKVDGQTTVFTGDLDTIVNETATGWSAVYWGTMNSPIVNLSAGAHQVEISSLGTYRMVDSLEAQKLPARW